MNDDEEKFLTKANFSLLVERTVVEKKIDYLEAVVLICEEKQLEVTDAAKLLNDVIKSKLEAEGIRAGTVKGSSGRLPV